MPSNFEIESLRYVVMPGNKISDGMKEYYERAYQMWKNIWSETFRELKGQTDLRSDEFMRQDEVTVLLNAETVVGFFAFSHLDLTLAAHRDHSYFKTYTGDVMALLTRASHGRVMTMGNLAVAPAWRRREAGPLVSEIMLGLATKRFLDSDASALIAFTRNNRKINELVYRYGAVPLKTGLIEHNVEVDIVMIDRQSVKESPLENVPAYVNELWNRRIT